MVESLPIEMKIILVDKILESLSPTEKEIDELWKAEVERRIEGVESGRVKTVTGEDVFTKVQERFGK
jgi:putative addiction module component (TIGR02574 family)